MDAILGTAADNQDVGSALFSPHKGCSLARKVSPGVFILFWFLVVLTSFMWEGNNKKEKHSMLFSKHKRCPIFQSSITTTVYLIVFNAFYCSFIHCFFRGPKIHLGLNTSMDKMSGIERSWVTLRDQHV